MSNSNNMFWDEQHSSFPEFPSIRNELNTSTLKSMPIDNSVFNRSKPGSFFEGFVDFIPILWLIGAIMTEEPEDGPKGIELDEVKIKNKGGRTIFDYRKFSVENRDFQNFWSFRGSDFPGQAILNKTIAYIDTNKIFIDSSGTGFTKYTLLIPYLNDSNVSLNNPNLSYLNENAAIKLKLLDIDGLLIILNNLENPDKREKQQYVENIYKTLSHEFERGILTNPTILSELDSLSPSLLKYFKDETLYAIFFGLLKISLVQKNEQIILKLLNTFYLKKNFNATAFLYKLLTYEIDGDNAFQVLYDKMNDWGGLNNFSDLIIEFSKLWVLSKYSNPNLDIYKKYEPCTDLVYKQKIVLGFRSDEYSFDFDEGNNIIMTVNPDVESPNRLTNYIIGKVLEEKHKYHVLQPITITELEETENEDLKLVKNVSIPAFYLKAFDDKGAWENFEKSIWLAVDIISLFTGIGNLAKLRYLIQTEKVAYVVLKTVFGVIEVTSSVVSIGLSLAENSKNKELVNKIREYLFWAEICTLSADVLSSRILAKKASEAGEILDEYRKTIKNRKQLEEIDEFAEHLEDVKFKSIFTILEEDGYAVLRDTDNKVIARAWLGSGGEEFNLFIKTKNTQYEGQGRAIFKKLFEFIEKEYAEEGIKLIRGTWRSNDEIADNLNRFNDLIINGVDPKSAALQTFTGKMSKELGYDNVNILSTSVKNSDGTYKSVDVIFSKSK